uniref:ATP-dependent Clp protease proteolytic subunit n=1 Tax=Nigella damascena TaxID=3444 RepID=A0A481Y3G5_NIGDA|nr:clp protease proteolytic subunit [Nigella damascena]QBK49534.1 clp protease proteolytic subunit [Nigella damascena]
MPVGIPKVAFRLPGDEEPSWVDLYRLHRERLLFLGEKLKYDNSNHIMSLMVFLTMEDSRRDIFLLLNTPGGGLLQGASLFDLMQFLQPDIYTVCVGLAASIGSYLLAGGTATKRIAFPHARVMVHQPTAKVRPRSRKRKEKKDKRLSEPIIVDPDPGPKEGQKTEVARTKAANELKRLRVYIAWNYACRTGQPLHVIYSDMNRDSFMSPEQAKTHGCIDLIGISENAEDSA